MNEEKKSVVFIVDDSITLRKMLQRVLETMDFKIYEAGCGEDALKLFNTITPDAILLDVEMPGIGGFVTCERVRSLPQGKHIPIMMVTGSEDEESINRAYRAGATDFTSKPINWDVIGHRVRYMIRTGRDYQELQRTKQELNQLNMDLEERVIQRTQQLKQTNQELKKTLSELQTTQDHLIESEKLASLGSLVAGVAHEVNTPIGIVVTGISLLMDKTESIDNLLKQNLLKRGDFIDYLRSVNEVIQLSERNLQHAIELVKSFKQVSADQISENRRAFNLKEYLEEIVFSLYPVLRKTKLTTQINCPTNLIIDSFPGILSQVMTIFIMNSIEHGYDPGQSGELVINVTLAEDIVQLEYSDTGKGVSEDNIKKIFDPFFTTRRGSGNIGLGLNIAWNSVVKMMAGSMKCYSQLGEGVKFTLTFPRGM